MKNVRTTSNIEIYVRYSLSGMTRRVRTSQRPRTHSMNTLMAWLRNPFIMCCQEEGFPTTFRRISIIQKNEKNKMENAVLPPWPPASICMLALLRRCVSWQSALLRSCVFWQLLNSRRRFSAATGLIQRQLLRMLPATNKNKVKTSKQMPARVPREYHSDL